VTIGPRAALPTVAERDTVRRAGGRDVPSGRFHACRHPQPEAGLDSHRDRVAGESPASANNASSGKSTPATSSGNSIPALPRGICRQVCRRPERPRGGN
jgi:hypothetical protein